MHLYTIINSSFFYRTCYWSVLLSGRASAPFRLPSIAWEMSGRTRNQEDCLISIWKSVRKWSYGAPSQKHGWWDDSTIVLIWSLPWPLDFWFAGELVRRHDRQSCDTLPYIPWSILLFYASFCCPPLLNLQPGDGNLVFGFLPACRCTVALWEWRWWFSSRREGWTSTPCPSSTWGKGIRKISKISISIFPSKSIGWTPPLPVRTGSRPGRCQKSQHSDSMPSWCAWCPRWIGEL